MMLPASDGIQFSILNSETNVRLLMGLPLNLAISLVWRICNGGARRMNMLEDPVFLGTAEPR
jgi:hypothetical protein